MNPGPWAAFFFLCLLPLVINGLAFWAGVRYARHGWQGILPKWNRVEHGDSILRTR